MVRRGPSSICFATALACFVFSLPGSGQEPAGNQGALNARDAFWSASDLVGKRPAPAAVHRRPVSQPAPSAAAERPASSVLPANSGVVSQISVKAPLGLRYSVLKKLPDGTYQEVSPDATFHQGDRIRLSLMANQPGYLYVVERGSSGRWMPLYPARTAASDASAAPGNQLEPGKQYLVPGKGSWEFRGEPGQERLFVLLSREPDEHLDQTIAALRNTQEGIGDQLVSQLRSEVQSRDLVFTNGDDEDSTSGGDQATYVVNKASGTTPDPHVVVDLVLSHR